MVRNEDPVLTACLTFFHEIGIEVAYVDQVIDFVVPGVGIVDGVLQISPDELLYPGDLLHEAGHLAVVPPAERSRLCNASIGARDQSEGEEMMAIAWSYAAALHLNLDPKLVFHDGGYKGGGSWIADAFDDGATLGLPMLKWVGMIEDYVTTAENMNINARYFPKMLRWMRD